MVILIKKQGRLTMNKHFSEKIKYLRTRLNLNQFEFAALIGIKQPSLSTYERGISSPTLDVAIAIAEKCNVSLDWLCGIESTPCFYTVADIILKLKAIGALYNITYTVESKMDETAEYLYECDIHLKSGHNTPDDDCLKYILEFIHNWKNTNEQLKNLPDEDIKQNYIQMWWEKQIAHYSTIPVKTRREANEEHSHKVYERWIPHLDELKLGEE